MARKKGFKMTDEHKAALAEGRRQGRIVRDYLAALEAGSKRGPKRSAGDLRKRINELDQQIEEEASPTTRLELVQKRRDQQQRLDQIEGAADIGTLERDFVGVADAYGQRKGLSYGAWREVGVPAKVLQRAGIGRSD